LENSLLAISTGLVVLLHGEESMAQNKMGDIYNNQGIITQGQTGNNTIIQGPVRLSFTQEIADDLVSRLPAGKTIVLQSIGSNLDQAVADQYQQYLQAKGFEIERAQIGMMMPPPNYKITLGNPSAPKMIVIIAPSAN
jgi:hypothetical protein